MVVEPNSSKVVSNTVFPLAHGVPRNHAPQRKGTIPLSFVAGELNQFAGECIAVFRNGSFCQHFVRGVVVMARHKADFPFGPPCEQRVVVVAPIHRNDGAGVERKGIGQLHVAAAGFGNQDLGGEVVVVIQQNVSFDAALSLAELLVAEPSPFSSRKRDSAV